MAKTWKQTKCPLTDEWIKKCVGCVCVCVCVYSQSNFTQLFKGNKIMPSAATWMDLEIIILNEVSQTKKNII